MRSRCHHALTSKLLVVSFQSASLTGDIRSCSVLSLMVFAGVSTKMEMKSPDLDKLANPIARNKVRKTTTTTTKIDTLLNDYITGCIL